MNLHCICSPLDLRLCRPRSLKVQANRSFRDLPIVVNSCSSGLITKKHTLDAPKNHGKNRIKVIISRLEIGSMDSIGLTNQIEH